MKYWLSAVFGACIGAGFTLSTHSLWSLLASFPLSVVNGMVIGLAFDKYQLKR